MLRTCGSRPILTTNLTTNEIPLVSTALGKTLENRAFAGTLVPVFYGSRRVRIPPTAPETKPPLRGGFVSGAAISLLAVNARLPIVRRKQE